jgi:hypothetical protein
VSLGQTAVLYSEATGIFSDADSGGTYETFGLEKLSRKVIVPRSKSIRFANIKVIDC